MAAIGIDMSDRDMETYPVFDQVIKHKTQLEIDYSWACQERDDLWRRYGEMVDSCDRETREELQERCLDAEKRVSDLYDQMMCAHRNTSETMRIIAGDFVQTEVCDDCGSRF